MKFLEKQRFCCTGIDINKEMLKIAKTKVKGDLIEGNMKNFNLPGRFDAIICMFATFNYNISKEDALITLQNFKRHLNPEGIVILDLHNPSSGGEKHDSIDEIERVMKWSLDDKKEIETTEVIFKIDGKEIRDSHKMRIYSPKEIGHLLKEAGFQEMKAYDGFQFKEASDNSKNILLMAK